MPTLHLHNLHRFPPSPSALPRATHFDRFTLVGHGEGFVIVAQHVRDGEVRAAVVLRWGEESFEDVREEEGGSVLGGGRLDVVVEDGDWGGDGCCWALWLKSIV